MYYKDEKTKKRVNILAGLSPGFFILLNRPIFAKPLLIEMPNVMYSFIPDDEIKNACSKNIPYLYEGVEFIEVKQEEIKKEKVADEKKHEEEIKLESKEYVVLGLISRFPGENQQELRERAEISPAGFKNIIDSLKSKELIKMYVIEIRKKGKGQPCVYKLSNKGEKIIGVKQKYKGKGGDIITSFWMNAVKKYFLSKKYEVFEEYKFNQDELWFADICSRKDDDFILVEIEISSSVVDIIKNCKKCLNHREITKLVLAIYTDTKNIMESKKVKYIVNELKYNLKREEFNKVEIKNLLEFYL